MTNPPSSCNLAKISWNERDKVFWRLGFEDRFQPSKAERSLASGENRDLSWRTVEESRWVRGEDLRVHKRKRKFSPTWYLQNTATSFPSRQICCNGHKLPNISILEKQIKKRNKSSSGLRPIVSRSRSQKSPLDRRQNASIIPKVQRDSMEVWDLLILFLIQENKKLS